MNANWILVSLATLCALPLLAPAQQSAAPRKLARLPQQDAPQATRAQSTDSKLEDWKQRLCDSDLERRESAFASLVESARGDRELRAGLEQWSASGAAPELAWTARLALRELRRSAPARTRGPGNEFNDLRQRFDELERNFGGMDSSFEDLRARMDGMLHALPQLPDSAQPAPLPSVPGKNEQFQSYTLQIGPDGVTFESTDKQDGNGHTQSYKAKDMDELLRDHPELREKLGGNSSLDLRSLPGQDGLFLRQGQPENDWLRSPRPSKQPPTGVLGIYSQKLTPEQAKELELEPEQGLRVERVEPGTIAQILGIRRGDTVVELDGQPIYSAEDVKRILKDRKPEADLSVTLLGEGSKERRTLRWSPAQPPTDEAPAPESVPGNAPQQPRKL